MKMKVPFVDLNAQLKQIKPEISKAIRKVIENGIYINGPNVDAFEKEFAMFCSTKYSIGVASGTDALRLSLEILNIKKKKVIAPSNTFISTIDGISHAGGIPILTDVGADYNISIQNLMKSKTADVILPVHLYGQMAKMDEIIEIAKKKNMFVLEDASQSHGAKFNKKIAGSFGIAGCFSFYPAKNLGAYGDGGAITTNDKEFAEKITMLRQHGEKKKHFHEFIGYNSRLDEIQATILRVKLRHLSKWNAQRRKVARVYNELLEKIPDVICPKEYVNRYHVYHLYVIRTRKRDKLREFLSSKNICTGMHYPIPIHLQKAYSHLKNKKGSFPFAEKVANEIISLPMYPEISEKLIQYVCDTIKLFFSNSMNK